MLQADDDRRRPDAAVVGSGRMTLQGFFEGTGMPDPGWWDVLFPDPAQIIRGVGVTPGMTVVDLCSGDGWFTLQLSKIAQAVTAIDIDGKMLERARVRLTEIGLTNCVFVEANAYDVARVVHDRVDHVFLANAFHGVPDKSRLAHAVHDVLKPGGTFAVMNWHARPREETTILGEPRGPATEMRMRPEETIAAMQSSGLTFMRQIEVPPYHYAVVFKRRHPCLRSMGIL
jgi:predicted methyltransferase